MPREPEEAGRYGGARADVPETRGIAWRESPAAQNLEPASPLSDHGATCLMEAPSLTLGIEEEHQVVDPDTRELTSYVTEVLEGDQMVLENLRPELHASTLEVAFEVCADLDEARSELSRLRRRVRGLARESGLEILSAGTHPSAAWQQQEITPLARYQGLQEDMAELARRTLVFASTSTSGSRIGSSSWTR